MKKINSGHDDCNYKEMTGEKGHYRENLQCTDRDKDETLLDYKYPPTNDTCQPYLSHTSKAANEVLIPDVVHISCASIPTALEDSVNTRQSHDKRSVHSTHGCCHSVWDKREPRESWMLLLRAMLYNVLQGFCFSIFTILYVPYTEVFQETKSNVGWIYSIGVAANCFVSMFISWPMEQWGNSRVAFILSLACSLGYALSCLAPSLPVLYITQGIIAGIGTSPLPVMVAVQQHFTMNRALANGLLMIGVNVGITIGPYLTEVLLQEYGWRGCLLFMSAIIAHKIPLALMLWPPRNQPQYKARPKTTAWRTILRLIKEALDFRLLGTNKIFLLFTLGTVIQGTFITAFFSHQASFAVYKGLSLERSAFIVSLSFLTAICSRLVLSVTSNMQCVNKMLQFTVGNVVGCLGVVCLICVPGDIGIFIGAVSMGLCLALTYTIHTVIVVDMVGLETLGRALGLLSCLSGIVALGGAPLCGWLYDSTGWYELAYIVLVCWQACGIILFIIVSVLQWWRSRQQAEDNFEKNNSDL